MAKNEIGSAVADRLRCAEPTRVGRITFMDHRPTPADLHAMEHGGYHIPADPNEIVGMQRCEHGVPKTPNWTCAICERDKLHEHVAEEPTCGQHPWTETAHYLSAWEREEHDAERRAKEALKAADAHLPTDAAARKAVPLYSGVMRYFPDALAAVAHLSQVGNDQHNPGQPLHWAKEKSNDHPDCLARHLLDAGTIDTDGVRHSAKVAWRALAMLQLEIEAAKEAGK